MNRDELLNAIKNPDDLWDFIVIGGGATGLGCAVDAANRGYRTLLLEQSDFAKGTSSRSTKLVHGGVRYLKQGNIPLVREALKERGVLLQNAPHLVRRQAFVIPHYARHERTFYGAGLKLYDLLAGQLGLGLSKHLSRAETLKHLPTLAPQGLRGGTLYYDAQFDDARLAISLAQTLVGLGGVPLNYLRVSSFLKAGKRIAGVVAKDVESGEEYELRARGVINATGVFADALRRVDDPAAHSIISPSQGAHLVLKKSFLPGDSALMVPRTSDGRVLFAIPWHDRVVLGTTDLAVESVSLEPRPLAQEIDFLLTHAARYLSQAPTPDQVLSTFAGLRPLVNRNKVKNTASLSRKHTMLLSKSGLITVIGGKWTTYRKMAEDTLNTAISVIGLKRRASTTTTLRLHGWSQPENSTLWQVYGADTDAVDALIDGAPAWRKTLHPNLPYRAGEVIWAVRHEMARTVEDVLARRTRALLLDARASVKIAPEVARLMAKELGKDERWEEEQVKKYSLLAQGYVLNY